MPTPGGLDADGCFSGEKSASMPLQQFRAYRTVAATIICIAQAERAKPPFKGSKPMTQRCLHVCRVLHCGLGWHANHHVHRRAAQKQPRLWSPATAGVRSESALHRVPAHSCARSRCANRVSCSLLGPSSALCGLPLGAFLIAILTRVQILGTSYPEGRQHSHAGSSLLSVCNATSTSLD